MSNIKKPSIFLQLTEGVRYTIDLVKALYFVSTYSFKTKGDKHAVLVVPGLMCTDFSTTLLRNFISKLGYTAYGWELGRNLGDLKDLNDIRKLQNRVAEIRQKHDGKITLVGWSMGGIYVRELAKMNPELFHQVITIGAPFADAYAPNNVEWFYKLIKNPADVSPVWREQMPIPAPIMTTALYSKQDGLVPWEACQEIIQDDLHRNIEITTGSHWGLVTNAEVFAIVAKQIPYSEKR